MASSTKAAEVSKSQLIKDHLAKHSDAKVKDVKEALASEGHEVSVALINKIKYGKKPKRSAKKPGRKSSNGKATTKKAATSKAQAIRDAFAALGKKARTSEVVQHLADKKIKVSPAQVSGLRKRKRRRTGAAMPGTTTQPTNGHQGLALEHLVAAKKLADQIGIATAKKALDALHTLGV